MSRIIKESARGYDCVSSEDILMTSRNIFLNSEVTAESAGAVIKDLIALNIEDPDKEITLYINSPGGSVQDGLAIFDYLRYMKAPFKTVCIGTAASMGAIIFLSAKKREIFPNGRILIHDPSYGGGDIGGKKPHEIQKSVDKLMETREILANIISDVTGKSLNEVYEFTREDSIFNASEAVNFGLATNIITDSKKKGK